MPFPFPAVWAGPQEMSGDWEQHVVVSQVPPSGVRFAQANAGRMVNAGSTGIGMLQTPLEYSGYRYTPP